MRPPLGGPVQVHTLRESEAQCSLSRIPVCDDLKPAGERGAHSDVVVIVEADDIAEVVVLVPAGAAAMAGPLVRPEAVVGCAEMQPLQQQVITTATAVAILPKS